MVPFPPTEWLERLLWIAVTLGLVCYFLIIPIVKVGFWQYITVEKDINPFTARIVKKYIYNHNRSLSKEWFERTTRIEEKDLPIVEWEEDTTTSKGINSMYCLDQQSDDCRPLLLPKWNLSYDKNSWWNAQKTGEYIFAPDKSPAPIYELERTDTTLHIKSGTKPDTWVYLVAKEKQPEVYKLEFDFISHTKSQETLQICFAAKSLASRFRFNLENNATMRFGVVDHGCFTSIPLKDLWSQYRFPYSIPLHQKIHVRLECINNKFALFYDNNLVMAVEIKDYQAYPSYWFLIFWNGFGKAYNKGKQDNYMDIEISNLKIYHPKQ